jgi:hypothetical protein
VLSSLYIDTDSSAQATMGSPPIPDQSGQASEGQTHTAAHNMDTDDPQREGSRGRDASVDEELPAPPYSETYGEMNLRQGGFGTSTRIAGTLATVYPSAFASY